jgi:hypothetical protein
MSVENNNNENMEQETQNKYWWKNSWVKPQPTYLFLIIIMLFCSLFLSGKCFAFQLFKDKNIDKGKWEVIKTELTEVRRVGVNAHLLPDGNVLIFGGTGLWLHENTVDVYDPRQQKIIKTIPIYTGDDFLWSTRYNTISLKNGDVYLVYNVKRKNRNKPYGEIIAKVFDSKTYTFHDVKAVKGIIYHELALIKDGNILIFESSPKISYIYDVQKDEYHEVNSPKYIFEGIIFRLKNGDFIVFRGKDKRYLFKDNKFEKYKDELPTKFETIQLDDENYLTLNAEIDCTTGYVVNIKENKKTPVLNKINRTWGANPYYPKLVLLDNKNVLILGIYAEYQGEKSRKKYTTHIYNFEKNKFYQIPNPPIYINRDTPAVQLQNGDILFVGGQLETKMEIYKYKH